MALHPNIDPELGAVAAHLGPALADFAAVRPEDVPDIRAQMAAVRAAIAPSVPDDRVAVEDRTVPGPEGAPTSGCGSTVRPGWRKVRRACTGSTAAA
nr:hypothetical protein GCM10020093_013760 [Planobispora longispora]